MALHLLKERGVPVERQRFTWREISPPTISKLDWDHAWHTAFVYDDEVRPLLPRGTVLLITSIFDNTANNPLNPDPNQWVVAGSRTIDEMSHIWVGLTEIEDYAEFQAMVAERERRGVPAAQQQ